MNGKWILPIAAAAILCSACSMIPQEEQLPNAPILRESESEQLVQVAVERGDLVKTLKLDCKFEPATEVKLSFGVDEKNIRHVYVKPGDTVEAGQLLLEFDNTDMINNIEAQQQKLDDLSRRVRHLEEQQELLWAKSNALIDAAARNPGKYSAQRDAVNRSSYEHSLELDYQKKLLEVEKMTMEELQAALAQRQIYSTLDGTVRSVARENENKWVREGQVVCTVANLSSGMFSTRADPGLFREGDKVLIEYDDEAHEAKVHEVLTKEGDKDLIRFQLAHPDATLKTGAKGQISVVSERRDQVLYLPKRAVEDAVNSKLVYYLDKNGIKQYKVVETGLVAGDLIEIVSGLEEGEMVIR